MPKVADNDIHLPFNYTTESDSQITIKFTNYSKDLFQFDPCLNIQYLLSSDNSRLQISYEDNSPIELTTFVDNSDQWIEEQICVNSLVKDIGEDFKIVLKSKLSKPNSDAISIKIGHNFISDVARDPALPKTFDYLRHWNESDSSTKYQFKNQWPLIYPRNVWKLSSDNEERNKQKITFESNFTIFSLITSKLIHF